MRLSGAATSRPGALSKSGSDAEGSLRRRSGSGLNGHHRVGEGTGAGPGTEVRDRTREESPSHGHRNVASTRSASRRRTLIQNYNDEDEDNTAPPSQVAQFKEQITPYQDVDIDMQLEDVSPEHGGSSLQISTSYDEYLAAPNQAAKPLDRHDTINLAETTPPTSIHKVLGKTSRPTHKVPNEEGAKEKGIHVLPIQVIPNTYAPKRPYQA